MEIDINKKIVIEPIENVVITFTPDEARDLLVFMGSLSFNKALEILNNKEQATRVRDMAGLIYDVLYNGM